jgi:small subunit ribosomal protein S12
MATLSAVVKKKTRRKKVLKWKRRALNFCPQRKGVCWKVTKIAPRKPCSANRAFTRVLLSNTNFVMCHIPGQRHNLKTRDVVLVRGGRPNDLPGVHYKVIRGKESIHPVIHRHKARSKYGVRALRFLRMRDIKNRTRVI